MGYESSFYLLFFVNWKQCPDYLLGEEIGESIPCDFACFVLFVFACWVLIVSWVSQMTFPGQLLKHCGEFLKHMVEYSWAPSVV